jgi:hypothetical protein
MFVYVVLSDTRETSHPTIINVRSSLSDARKDAKAYMLKHNVDETGMKDFSEQDLKLNAKDFCAKYLDSAWIVSAGIEKRKVK